MVAPAPMNALRAMMRETSMTPDNLIWPIFLQAGKDEESAIASMPANSPMTINQRLAF